MPVASISVVVCTANRANSLAHMLLEFSKITFPKNANVEMIVVDNNSSDNTADVVAQAGMDFPVPIRYVRETRQGSGFALNRGLDQSSGEIIASTDDDCVVADDWLVRITQAFAREPRMDVVGGRVELYDDSHHPITIKTSRTPEIMGETTFPGGILLGCNVAFRRGVVERIGGFDPRFGAGAPLKAGEDAEFVYRAYKAGFKILYEPSILVYHNHKRVHPDQIRKLQSNYVRSDGALLMKHMLEGDRRAIKWYYWRLSRLLSGLLAGPLTSASLLHRARLVGDMFGGAFALWRVRSDGPSGTTIVPRVARDDPSR